MSGCAGGRRRPGGRVGGGRAFRGLGVADFPGASRGHALTAVGNTWSELPKMVHARSIVIIVVEIGLANSWKTCI